MTLITLRGLRYQYYFITQCAQVSTEALQWKGIVATGRLGHARMPTWARSWRRLELATSDEELA